MPERAGNWRSRGWCRQPGQPAGGSAPSRSSICRSILSPPGRSADRCFPDRDEERALSNREKSLQPRVLHHWLVAAALLLLLSPGLALAAPAGTVVGLSGASVVESGGARA